PSRTPLLAVGHRPARGAHGLDNPLVRIQALLLENATSLAIQVCRRRDRKSTRLNSSHVKRSYGVFCLKKKPIARRRDSCPRGSSSYQRGKLACPLRHEYVDRRASSQSTPRRQRPPLSEERVAIRPVQK